MSTIRDLHPELAQRLTTLAMLGATNTDNQAIIQAVTLINAEAGKTIAEALTRFPARIYQDPLLQVSYVTGPEHEHAMGHCNIDDIPNEMIYSYGDIEIGLEALLDSEINTKKAA